MQIGTLLGRKVVKQWAFVSSTQVTVFDLARAIALVRARYIHVQIQTQMELSMDPLYAGIRVLISAHIILMKQSTDSMLCIYL